MGNIIPRVILHKFHQFTDVLHTLTLLNTPPIVELYLVEDDDGIYLLPIIDNQFVLNYELGTVNNYSEIQDEFKVLQKYNKEQIKNIT